LIAQRGESQLNRSKRHGETKKEKRKRNKMVSGL